ncbi:response regulator transcription factor [Streptomyces echinoruber]|uniref:HTH luxR-type domain-containing protein n=1 Tax=Streptomyces echinoruber TaxID=68898 RepID=A0A918QW54_9ACTN|nr:LuxR C-terminal-related transcriptional regulator [Streptomyces echinoruber]GGZ73484.1 hypothetical protein GCM10010389_08870 [Streptomyces echinoruber]
MPTTAPPRLLTPGELRVAELLVRGLSPGKIAADLGLSRHTVRGRLYRMRAKLHCPPRCPRPLLVHLLLTSRQVTPPEVQRPAPPLSPEELRLLHVLAAHHKPMADVDFRSFRRVLKGLLAKTEAANAAHLMALAHAWKLLGARQGTAAPAGASR